MKIVGVTGTPGTGKTTLSKMLAKATGLSYIDVTEIIKDKGIDEGFDNKRKCLIVDTDRLFSEIKSHIKKIKGKGVIIDSHLSHYLPADFLQILIITTCDIGMLKERLKERGYDESKIRENLDAEIFSLCSNEALEYKHNRIEVNTSNGVSKQKVEEIADAIKKL